MNEKSFNLPEMTSFMFLLFPNSKMRVHLSYTFVQSQVGHVEYANGREHVRRDTK